MNYIKDLFNQKVKVKNIENIACQLKLLLALAELSLAGHYSKFKEMTLIEVMITKKDLLNQK